MHYVALARNIGVSQAQMMLANNSFFGLEIAVFFGRI
jgi:hypothetical protein